MKQLFSFPFLLFLFLVTAAFRQGASPIEPSPPVTIFQHLQNSAVQEMTLELDFKRYHQRQKADNYYPGKLTFFQPGGKVETWDVEVRQRGKMRRLVCDLPPMKFRFSEEQLESRGLDKRRTLKMVNICKDLSKYEQMLLREYLAYRFYNAITEYSFRVHLVKVKYLNLDGEREQDDSFAFFIEHPKDLADRTDLTFLEEPQVDYSHMNTPESERFTLFQYMIGNTDWYYFNNHNVELFENEATKTIVPVPYDFDYSGLAKAPYAVPDTRLKIRHVTERYYQGRCRPAAETQLNIDEFLAKKPAIFQAVDNLPHLTKYSKKFTDKYLKVFFATIEKSKRWKRAFTQHCDRWPVP